MNRDRKILLIILFFSVYASLSAINIIMLNDRRFLALSNRELLESQYEKLIIRSVEIPSEEIRAMQSWLDTERERFFSRDETDPYKLGLEIIDKLESHRLTVSQYRTLEMEDNIVLEFSIQGQVNRFFSFWEDLYRQNCHYTVPQLSIKNEKQGISTSFRIGYALNE